MLNILKDPVTHYLLKSVGAALALLYVSLIMTDGIYFATNAVFVLTSALAFGFFGLSSFVLLLYFYVQLINKRG